MPPPEFSIDVGRLVERFGRWPSFHDSEVVRLSFDRCGEGAPSAELLIHVWKTLAEVDDKGFFRRDTHTLVNLRATHLMESQLEGFNHQNVIFDLTFSRCEFCGVPAVRMDMSTSHGLSGYLICHQIAVASVTPCGDSLATDTHA